MAKPVVTTLLMDERTWMLLRHLAALRAERVGGRPSQSAVVRELVKAASSKGGRRAGS